MEENYDQELRRLWERMRLAAAECLLEVASRFLKNQPAFNWKMLPVKIEHFLVGSGNAMADFRQARDRFAQFGMNLPEGEQWKLNLGLTVSRSLEDLMRKIEQLRLREGKFENLENLAWGLAFLACLLSGKATGVRRKDVFAQISKALCPPRQYRRILVSSGNYDPLLASLVEVYGAFLAITTVIGKE